MLQNATHLRKSPLGPPSSSDENVSCIAPATENECIFADPLQMSHACHRFWTCYKTLTLCSRLRRCTIPCACHAKAHLNLQKWREHVVHFDFKMCFVPQRRALFRHLNFHKWSEHGVFCTFRLRNLLHATTACTFSTSQLPKVVRTCGAVRILTSKCASRHNGMHFFDVATSKNGPNLVCFVHFDFEVCFAPQRRALFNSPTPKSAPKLRCLCTF